MAATELNGVSRELELTAVTNRPSVTVDLRHHITSVERIYHFSGAGTAGGHYCPCCGDSGAKVVGVRRCADHWECCDCEAAFYD
jgi:hypothetical protein